MNEQYRCLAQYLETFISMPREAGRGFYNQDGKITDAGFLCALHYLIKSGIFENERELAIAYGKETGHMLSDSNIELLLTIGESET